ncbi:MAG: tetratricopeptide repeat protein [Desulfotomaculaceae bacterium]|nr:tetratricopeptide repeat protein [Desulfotomaculaceae bacterium]
MFIRKSVKRNKFRRVLFVVITALIAIGLVIPLAGLFSNQSDYSGGQGTNTVQQTPQERLADLENKAKESPGDVSVLVELAQAYFYAGNPDQATKTYEQVLTLDANNSAARYDMATIYYYSSKYDLAVAQLQELLKNDPDNKAAHYFYGIVLGTGIKDYQGGITELEKFVELAKEGSDVEKARQLINEWKATPAQ